MNKNKNDYFIINFVLKMDTSVDTNLQVKYGLIAFKTKNISHTGDKYAPRSANMGTIGEQIPREYHIDNNDIVVNTNNVPAN